MRIASTRKHSKSNEIETIRSIDQFFSYSLALCVYYLPIRCSYITLHKSFHIYFVHCCKMFRQLLFEKVITMIQKYECGGIACSLIRLHPPHNPTQVHICLIHIPHERDFCSMRNSMGVFVRVCVLPPQSISIANESIYTMPVWIYLMFVQRLTLCAAYASQVEINFQWLNLTVPNFAQMFAAWIGFGFGFGHSTWYYATSVLCGNVC